MDTWVIISILVGVSIGLFVLNRVETRRKNLTSAMVDIWETIMHKVPEEDRPDLSIRLWWFYIKEDSTIVAINNKEDALDADRQRGNIAICISQNNKIEEWYI